MTKFWERFETKHLIAGVLCTALGWGVAQIHSLGVEQATIRANIEAQNKEITDLNTLPPLLLKVGESLVFNSKNIDALTEIVKANTEELNEQNARIIILEYQQREVDG